jgi:hypothetical protein
MTFQVKVPCVRIIIGYADWMLRLGVGLSRSDINNTKVITWEKSCNNVTRIVMIL